MATDPSLIFSAQVTGLEQDIQRKWRQSQRFIQRNPITVSIKDDASLPLGRITNRAGEFDKALQAATDRVVGFGIAAGVIFQVQRAFQELFRSAVEVEQSLARINVNLQASADGLKQFSREIFDIAKNTGQTFRDTAKAAEELARQGLSAEQTTQRLRDALILSRLAAVDSISAVENLTAAVNSYASEALTTTDVINRLVAVDTSFAVSTKDLSDALSRVGSSAADVGVEFNELLAIVTSVQQTTARGGAVIGNSFKTIFTRIQRPEVLNQLEDLGIAIRDVSGNTLPAIQILQNLARTYDTLSQSQQSIVSEQVGGVFQINILKAALGDLSKEYSIYSRALGVANGATDEAIRKNQELNKTLATLLNETAQGFVQLFAAIGESKAGELFKNIIGNVNDVLRFLTKAGEDGGKSVGESIVQGLSNVLAGPALFTAIIFITKALSVVGKEALKALQSLAQQNTLATARATIQKNINTLLANATTQEQAQFATARSIAQQKQVILDIQTRITNETLRQVAAQRALQNAFIIPKSGIRGSVFNQRTNQLPGVLNAAGGFVPGASQLPPVQKEIRAIKSGVGGATPTAKPVIIPNFAFGGGKRGTVVANTDEYIVPNFAGGGTAVFNKDMVRSMGLPRGARKINAAGGYIPNFNFENFLASIDPSYLDEFKKIEKADPSLGKFLRQVVDARGPEAQKQMGQMLGGKFLQFTPQAFGLGTTSYIDLAKGPKDIRGKIGEVFSRFKMRAPRFADGYVPNFASISSVSEIPANLTNKRALLNIYANMFRKNEGYFTRYSDTYRSISSDFADRVGRREGIDINIEQLRELVTKNIIRKNKKRQSMDRSIDILSERSSGFYKNITKLERDLFLGPNKTANSFNQIQGFGNVLRLQGFDVQKANSLYLEFKKNPSRFASDSFGRGEKIKGLADTLDSIGFPQLSREFSLEQSKIYDLRQERAVKKSTPPQLTRDQRNRVLSSYLEFRRNPGRAIVRGSMERPTSIASVPRLNSSVIGRRFFSEYIRESERIRDLRDERLSRRFIPEESSFSGGKQEILERYFNRLTDFNLFDKRYNISIDPRSSSSSVSFTASGSGYGRTGIDKPYDTYKEIIGRIRKIISSPFSRLKEISFTGADDDLTRFYKTIFGGDSSYIRLNKDEFLSKTDPSVPAWRRLKIAQNLLATKSGKQNINTQKDIQGNDPIQIANGYIPNFASNMLLRSGRAKRLGSGMFGDAFSLEGKGIATKQFNSGTNALIDEFIYTKYLSETPQTGAIKFLGPIGSLDRSIKRGYIGKKQTKNVGKLAYRSPLAYLIEVGAGDIIFDELGLPSDVHTGNFGLNDKASKFVDNISRTKLTNPSRAKQIESRLDKISIIPKKRKKFLERLGKQGVNFEVFDPLARYGGLASLASKSPNVYKELVNAKLLTPTSGEPIQIANGFIPNFANPFLIKRGKAGFKGEGSFGKAYELLRKNIVTKVPKSLDLSRFGFAANPKNDIINDFIFSKVLGSLPQRPGIEFSKPIGNLRRSIQRGYTGKPLVQNAGSLSSFNKTIDASLQRIVQREANSIIQSVIPPSSTAFADVNEGNYGFNDRGKQILDNIRRNEFTSSRRRITNTLSDVGSDPRRRGIFLDRFAKAGGKFQIFDPIANRGTRGVDQLFKNFPEFFSSKDINFSKGYIPNFANPLFEAIKREQNAGIKRSDIYVDRDSRVRSPMNPLGLLVANKIDEPQNGAQGVNRAIRQGINPKFAGMAKGYIPNFVDEQGLFTGGDRLRAAGTGRFLDRTQLNAINAALKLYQQGLVEGSKELKNQAKALASTVPLTQQSKSQLRFGFELQDKIFRDRKKVEKDRIANERKIQADEKKAVEERNRLDKLRASDFEKARKELESQQPPIPKEPRIKPRTQKQINAERERGFRQIERERRQSAGPETTSERRIFAARAIVERPRASAINFGKRVSDIDAANLAAKGNVAARNVLFARNLASPFPRVPEGQQQANIAAANAQQVRLNAKQIAGGPSAFDPKILSRASKELQKLRTQDTLNFAQGSILGGKPLNSKDLERLRVSIEKSVLQRREFGGLSKEEVQSDKTLRQLLSRRVNEEFAPVVDQNQVLRSQKAAEILEKRRSARIVQAEKLLSERNTFFGLGGSRKSDETFLEQKRLLQGPKEREALRGVLDLREERRQARRSSAALGAAFVAPFAAGFIPEGQGQTRSGVALGAASGALQGAGFGALLGPKGVVVGAIAGGLVGAFSKLTKSASEIGEKFDKLNEKAASTTNSIGQYLQIQEQLNNAVESGQSEDVLKRLTQAQLEATKGLDKDLVAKLKSAGTDIDKVAQVYQESADKQSKLNRETSVGLNVSQLGNTLSSRVEKFLGTGIEGRSQINYGNVFRRLGSFVGISAQGGANLGNAEQTAREIAQVIPVELAKSFDSKFFAQISQRTTGAVTVSQQDLAATQQAVDRLRQANPTVFENIPNVSADNIQEIAFTLSRLGPLTANYTKEQAELAKVLADSTKKATEAAKVEKQRLAFLNFGSAEADVFRNFGRTQTRGFTANPGGKLEQDRGTLALINTLISSGGLQENALPKDIEAQKKAAEASVSFSNTLEAAVAFIEGQATKFNIDTTRLRDTRGDPIQGNILKVLEIISKYGGENVVSLKNLLTETIKNKEANLKTSQEAIKQNQSTTNSGTSPRVGVSSFAPSIKPKTGLVGAQANVEVIPAKTGPSFAPSRNLTPEDRKAIAERSNARLGELTPEQRNAIKTTSDARIQTLTQEQKKAIAEGNSIVPKQGPRQFNLDLLNSKNTNLNATLDKNGRPVLTQNKIPEVLENVATPSRKVSASENQYAIFTDYAKNQNNVLDQITESIKENANKVIETKNQIEVMVSLDTELITEKNNQVINSLMESIKESLANLSAELSSLKSQVDRNAGSPQPPTPQPSLQNPIISTKDNGVKQLNLSEIGRRFTKNY